MLKRPFRIVILAMALAAALVPLSPALVERWYSRAAYPLIQQALTPIANLVPLALFDPALAGVGLLLVVQFVRRVRRDGVWRGLGGGVATLATVAAGVYLAFLLVWGLNYRRVPLEERLDFDPSRVTREAVASLAREAVQEVNALHGDARRLPDEAALWDAFVQVQPAVGTAWRPRMAIPKRSLLELYFRRAAIDGMTDPFFLEIVLNPDLLPFERPYVVAHEWAHLSGHADEAEASYVAWLACMAGDASARYSAWLALYSTVVSDLPRTERRAIASALAEGPRQDLQAVAQRLRRAMPALTRVARESYDAYLRANRVDEGIESYGRVVRLVLGASDGSRRMPKLRASR